MITIDNCGQADWDGFATKVDNANFLNSWQWGEVHDRLGHKVYRLAIYRDEKVIGLLLAIVKDAKRGRYLEVPGGPLIDWSDKAVVDMAVDRLRSVARENKCVFVRIRPQLSDTKESRDLLISRGFREALMHLYAEHTNILDLSPSLDELLKAMRQQTRYEVKRADKEGIVVTQSSSQEDLALFQDIQAGTARRQGFVPPSPKFLSAQLEVFGNSFKIYKAEKAGKLLSMAIVISFGEEADYYEGASTEAGRKLPGAYAIQWRAIQDAKASGFKRYNFWGIAHSNNPGHRYAGVTTFKRGFGGVDVTFVPAHDLVLKKLGYLKNWSVEYIRKKVRKL